MKKDRPIKKYTGDASLIDKLQQEAKHQAQLEKKKILSSRLSRFSRIVALYPWQFLLITSFITTVIFEIVYRLRQ